MAAQAQTVAPRVRNGVHIVSRLVREAVAWAGGCSGDPLSPAEGHLLDPQTVDERGTDELGVPFTFTGEDPVGEALAAARSVEERRDLGQFLTPPAIVRTMLAWVTERNPQQLVDAGCGSGRFALAAAAAMPHTRVIAVDSDPAATLLCRAAVRRAGLSNVRVLCADYLRDDLGLAPVRTAFVGNPPYIRHHRLAPDVKWWGATAAKTLGVPFSALAGMHVYFFLATALRARPGDCGCFITSAEWLDVHYGRGLRELLLRRLGVRSVSLLDESCSAFPDAMTSAAITCFEVGRSSSTVRVSTVREFRHAEGASEGRDVDRAQLSGRWRPVIRGTIPLEAEDGLVRLGDLLRVHRGVATGANRFFVLAPELAKALGLSEFARPVISAAQQIIQSAGAVTPENCDVLIVLPKDLKQLPSRKRDAVREYLERGEREGVCQRYLCLHRTPWWWLGDPQPPPIIASYMARRPPTFALNPHGLLILNIAHGLYPRRSLPGHLLGRLVAVLNERADGFRGGGRCYQGGLEKFEPGEMEDLRVPLTGVMGD